MSGVGKAWNNRRFFLWIYRVSDAATRANWLHSLIHNLSQASSTFWLFVWISAFKVGVAKICEVCCVNRHHAINISNIKIPDALSFMIIPGIFGEILQKSVKSIYPINLFRVVVFLPKSNARFKLLEVRKQLAPCQETSPWDLLTRRQWPDLY